MMGNDHSFLANLENRRAVKHFAEGEVNTTYIRKAIVAAPSSFGIQPYKVIAITNKETKQQLLPVSYNQPQVTECHTLFVFCARTDVEARAEEYLKATGAENIREMLMGFLSYLPDKTAWAARQTYIALGFALAAAAEQQVASCPMEGLNSAEVAKILNLPENLQPLAYLAVGEDAGEAGTPYPRFRFPDTDLLEDRD